MRRPQPLKPGRRGATAGCLWPHGVPMRPVDQAIEEDMQNGYA